MIKAGIYQHYKGHNYEVIGVASHSEDESLLVVYRPLYGEGGLWVRPLAMFREEVSVNGRSVARFRFVAENASQLPHDIVE